MGQFLKYLIYGAVSGFSRYTPLSTSAGQRLAALLLKMDSGNGLLCFFIHAGALLAAILLCRQRMLHLYRQMRLVTVPPKERRRPPDMEAVLDARLILTMAAPAVLGAWLSPLVSRMEMSLLVLAILLIVGGVAVYLPEYLPGGDRKARSLSPLEATGYGLLAALSVIPGLSAVGLMLALAQLRKCDRRYMTDAVMLTMGVMLCGALPADLLSWLIDGCSIPSAGFLLQCLIAGAAAFGGGMGAMLSMRYLAVKTGFSGFAFCNWGIGLFCFLLYLML